MLIGIDASRTTIARRTGTEAYSLELTRALLALTTEHRWRLYFNQAPARNTWPHRPGVEQRVMPFSRLWTHLRLSLEMFEAPPDVLFVPAHVLPLVRPRHSVVTVHDLGYHHFPDAHTRSALAYLKLSTRMNARWATLILADSEATRNDLMRIYRTPAEKIRVVYPGRNEGLQRVVDRDRIGAVAGSLGIGGDYILYLGTLQPRKNLVRLVEAFGEMLAAWNEDVPPPTLVLAGKKGWLSGDIFRSVERLDLSKHVLFPGYVPDEDLPALLSGARVFAFPSLYEGFGFPVLEAMACDVPVVCADSSSLPEAAGDAALRVDPLDTEALAEALHRALTNESLRSQLIQAGRQQIQQFSWQKSARQTLEVLEEAAAR